MVASNVTEDGNVAQQMDADHCEGMGDPNGLGDNDMHNRGGQESEEGNGHGEHEDDGNTIEQPESQMVRPTARRPHDTFYLVYSESKGDANKSKEDIRNFEDHIREFDDDTMQEILPMVVQWIPGVVDLFDANEFNFYIRAANEGTWSLCGKSYINPFGGSHCPNSIELGEDTSSR